jgi:predicted DCC family thiol-disulfide oxidoreductase YuxK
MKPSTKIIIYDDTCPLCAAYTNAFVASGFIKKENRKNFTTISPQLLALINIEKSKNEIPVIDTQTNQVFYGIDALLEILNVKFKGIKAIANLKPLKWFLLKLYKFISYNRRVIVAKAATQGNFDCTPHFSIKYRLFFALVFLLLNSVLLFPLHKYVIADSILSSTIMQLQVAHFALVACNIFIAISLKKYQGIEYIGQINMLATVTILLLLPLIFINKYFFVADVFNILYLTLLSIVVYKEYWRRMNFIQLFRYHKWVVAINAVSILLFLTYLIL